MNGQVTVEEFLALLGEREVQIYTLKRQLASAMDELKAEREKNTPKEDKKDS